MKLEYYRCSWCRKQKHNKRTCEKYSRLEELKKKYPVLANILEAKKTLEKLKLNN